MRTLARVIIVCLLVVVPHVEASTLMETSTLLDRAIAFAQSRPDGIWRLRERGAEEFIARFVAIVESETVEDVWPSPELVLAKAWWESRWRPRARGGDGEHGLLQMMPRFARRYLRDGETDSDLFEPEVNVRVAIERLRDDYSACGEDPAKALTRYASAQCVIRTEDGRVIRPGWPERNVLLWTEQLKAAIIERQVEANDGRAGDSSDGG